MCASPNAFYYRDTRLWGSMAEHVASTKRKSNPGTDKVYLHPANRYGFLTRICCSFKIQHIVYPGGEKLNYNRVYLGKFS